MATPNKPTIKELVDVLAGEVDWHSLGISLGMKPGKLDMIREENAGNVRRCLTSMVTKWQKANPSQGWPDIIKALKDLEEEELAEEVARKYCGGSSAVAGSPVATTTASTPPASVDDIKKFGRTIKEKLQLKWDTLSECLEAEMGDFAKKLFAKQLISKGARKDEDFDKIMDEFNSGMSLFENVEEYKGHCSTLLEVLADIGGPAGKVGIALKKSWNDAVRVEYGITEFLK